MDGWKKVSYKNEVNECMIQTRDTISQVYLGLKGSVDTQEKAQRRINWMASQVKQGKVLDVGCSEGILSILLARKGIDVTGIDINAEALAYAQELLNKELETVRSKVKFIHGDLLDIEFEKESFDIVVVGEVLKHLLHPEIMLEKACSLLKPQGLLIVTTPFGYFPASDHKQTFTLLNFSNLLKPFVSVKYLSVEDGYIRFIGNKEINGETNWVNYNNTTLLKISERATIDQQIFLRNNLERWKNAENRMRQEYERFKKLHNEERDDLVNRLTMREQENSQQKENLQETIEQLKYAEKTIDDLKKKILDFEDLKRTLENLKKTNAELKNQIDRQQKSRERAAFNYYVTRHNLHRVKESFSYKLGQALVKAMAKPGKNTLLLPFRLAKITAISFNKKINKDKPEVDKALVKLPDKIIKEVAFITNKPQFVFKEGEKIIYSLPEEEAAYITSKKNANFNKPPLEDTFFLKPNILYKFSCLVDCGKDSKISLWLIEYNNRNRLCDKKIVLSPGQVNFNFRTHSEHERLCLAFRLIGSGFIKILGIDIVEKSDMEAEINIKESEKLQIDKNKGGFSLTSFSIGLKDKYKQLTTNSKRSLKFNPNSPFHRGKLNLLKYGFIPDISKDFSNYQPKDGCVFYLLHSSLPYIGSGYAIRSQEILSSLCSNGIEIYGVSRLGFPWDLKNVNSHGVIKKEKINNVTYLRLPTKNSGFSQIPLDKYMNRYLEEVLNLAQEYRPSIIHSASNYVDGNVAIKAAKLLGVPSVYEVRGLWEITRVSREPWWELSEEYTMCVRMETQACLEADVVIAITPALKDYLVSNRGIPEHKITVVPNGVDTTRFVPVARNKDLETRYGFEGKTIIGFVGSMVEYEGLDLLLEASKILFSKRDDFRVLLVGDGRCFEELKKQTLDYSLQEKVIFTGRVSHDEVEKYYSLIDITPFPRKGSLVCELTSPLKPFEAMAMEKCVVASNVAALSEIIKDRKTGMLFQKDNVNDLAKVLEYLLDNPEQRKELSKLGRHWVIEERDWDKQAQKIYNLYKLLSNNKGEEFI